VLTAVVAAKDIKPSEEELLQAVAPIAEREGLEPAKLLEDLRKAGRLEELSEDLAARMAVELIAEHSTPISHAQAQARDALWTPGQSASAQQAVAGQSAAGRSSAGPGELWTPTDQRSGS
jgi:hypothetical protein